jgi:Exo70 exocyst complex subunit
VSIAVANNVRYILAIISEHQQLSEFLGRTWRASQEDKLQAAFDSYYEETWQPVAAMLTQMLADVRGEARPAARCIAWTVPCPALG